METPEYHQKVLLWIILCGKRSQTFRSRSEMAPEAQKNWYWSGNHIDVKQKREITRKNTAVQFTVLYIVPLCSNHLILKKFQINILWNLLHAKWEGRQKLEVCVLTRIKGKWSFQIRAFSNYSIFLNNGLQDSISVQG